MKYYIIAGEASGDLHGSNLMKGLYDQDTGADIRFWGGDMMSEVFSAHQTPTSANPGLVRHYRECAVMGFTDILGKAGKILGNFSFCKRDIVRWKPDVVILIDYPGFNLRIAEFTHSCHIKTFYYIAPKTWATREYRNRKLKRCIDRMFIIFPFEIPYFKSKGIPFTYNGNPLVEAVDSTPAPKPEENKYIALLAGSRKGEIKRMMPVYMEIVSKMRTMPEYADYRYLIAGAPSRTSDDYLPYIGDNSDIVDVRFGQTYGIIKHARAAIINSGTVSLETVLLGTPQVVVYKLGWVISALSKVVKLGCKYVSLGNLIIDKLAFKEILNDDFTADNVIPELRRLLDDEQYRERMISDYRVIRTVLGEKNVSQSIARAMIDELKK